MAGLKAASSRKGRSSGGAGKGKGGGGGRGGASIKVANKQRSKAGGGSSRSSGGRRSASAAASTPSLSSLPHRRSGRSGEREPLRTSAKRRKVDSSGAPMRTEAAEGEAESTEHVDLIATALLREEEEEMEKEVAEGRMGGEGADDDEDDDGEDEESGTWTGRLSGLAAYESTPRRFPSSSASQSSASSQRLPVRLVDGRWTQSDALQQQEKDNQRLKRKREGQQRQLQTEEGEGGERREQEDEDADDGEDAAEVTSPSLRAARAARAAQPNSPEVDAGRIAHGSRRPKGGAGDGAAIPPAALPSSAPSSSFPLSAASPLPSAPQLLQQMVARVRTPSPRLPSCHHRRATQHSSR